MVATVVLMPGWEKELAVASFPAREAAMARAEATAKRVCPRRTDALAESIVGEALVESMDCRLSAGDPKVVDYAAVVELGGRPHEIWARGPWALSNEKTMLPGDRLFFVGGPGAHVHHPGTPAQPYLRPGVYAIGETV